MPVGSHRHAGASVLIDATVVRLLLVPAVITLLDRSAWWTPRRLDRVLPHLSTEGGPQAPLAGVERP